MRCCWRVLAFCSLPVLGPDCWHCYCCTRRGGRSELPFLLLATWLLLSAAAVLLLPLLLVLGCLLLRWLLPLLCCWD